MKKVISLIVAAALMTLVFASCAKQAKAFTVDENKVSAVHLTKFDNDKLDVDRKAFTKAYNEATVGKTVESAPTDCSDIILFTLAEGKPVVVYFTGDSDFVVTSDDIKEPFAITSDALAKLYNDAADKAAETTAPETTAADTTAAETTAEDTTAADTTAE